MYKRPDCTNYQFLVYLMSSLLWVLLCFLFLCEEAMILKADVIFNLKDRFDKISYVGKVHF